MSRNVPIIMIFALLMLSYYPGTQAKVYTNDAHHYSLEVPDSWTEQSSPGADVLFRALDGSNMNIVSSIDATASDDPAWLLQAAQAGMMQVVALFSANVVQAPRTFQTASGLNASDYIVNYTMGSVLELRQIIFGSDTWDMYYIISCTAEVNLFGTYNTTWNHSVDTFAILPPGEKNPPIIKNISPANNSTVHNGTPEIGANYSDDSGTNVSSVVLLLDGNDVTSLATVTAAGIKYIPSNATLSNGTHTIILNVSDVYGNSASKTWRFRVDIRPQSQEGSWWDSNTWLILICVISVSAIAGAVMAYTFMRRRELKKKKALEQASSVERDERKTVQVSSLDELFEVEGREKKP